MKTAVEICRDFVEYAKNRGAASEEYTKILDDAKMVVEEATKSGELSRQSKAGDQLNTGLLFRGHKIILEVTDHWHPSFGCRYDEDMLRKKFADSMKSRLEVW